MENQEIFNRIEKAKARKQAKEKAIAKKQKMLENLSRDSVDRTWVENDIQQLKGEIEKIDELIASYTEKLNNKAIISFVYENYVPQIFKDLEANLVKKWFNIDCKLRDDCLKDKESLASASESEYAKLNESIQSKYSKYIYGTLSEMSDDEIMRADVDSAHQAIIDLFVRILQEVGEVNSWDMLYLNDTTIYGKVSGSTGSVQVETISAGGYNVQRAHNRFIVSKL